MARKKLQKISPPRLFAEDVVLLKRQAAAEGIPWQMYLRLLVSRALKKERKVVVL